MDVDEKIITSSTVQANVSYSNEDMENNKKEQQEQVELGKSAYEQGENHQPVQEVVETKEQDNKKQFAEGFMNSLSISSAVFAIILGYLFSMVCCH